MLTLETLMGLRLSHCRTRIEFPVGSWSFLPGPNDVLEWLKLTDAGWVHDGDPTKPHALLHSKKHSTAFFLLKRLLKYGNLREILAACLVEQLRNTGLRRVDGVFGAPYSSITLAADVARLLGVPNYIVEKGPKDANGKDTMVFKSDDPIPGGSVLLRVEELITTLDSCKMASDAIVAGNPNPVAFDERIAVVVYRPPVIQRLQLDGSIIVPLVEQQVDAWDAGDCPLCRAGSEALAPKGENWAKLVA